MSEITYLTLQRIFNALGSDFGRSAMMMFKDTEGRTWAIVHGHLLGSPATYRDGSERVGLVDYGCIGSYELVHLRGFEYRRKNSCDWRIMVGGVYLQFQILPPFDCLDCKHLIYVTEEECATEGGGYACRYDWERGDTYIAWNPNECRGCVCSKFEPCESSLRRGLYGFRA